ncbi:unnamed protein product [Camellia sinensis]
MSKFSLSCFSRPFSFLFLLLSFRSGFRERRAMKSCELCKSAARMYCESDQASLCWDCDAKVHSANFLVARHSRSLLCHVCQSPTPWNASGARVGRTVSVCESCFEVKDNRVDEEENEGDNYNEIDTEEDEYGDDEKEDADDEEGDNQVVPWSSTPPPPPAESSSSSEESSNRSINGDGVVSLKQLHENAADLHSDDDLNCVSSRRKNSSPPPASLGRDSETDFVDALRPLKRRRIETNRSEAVQRGPDDSRSTAIVESLKGLHERDVTSGHNASSAIVRIFKLSGNL